MLLETEESRGRSLTVAAEGYPLHCSEFLPDFNSLTFMKNWDLEIFSSHQNQHQDGDDGTWDDHNIVTAWGLVQLKTRTKFF